MDVQMSELLNIARPVTFCHIHPNMDSWSFDMSEFQRLFDVFRAQPSLSTGLTLDQVLQFVVYAIRLRNDIVLVQPADHLPERVPDFLPHSVEGFLSEACSIHLDLSIPALWGALRETVWGGTFGKFLKKEPHLSAFAQHGHNHGLSMFLFAWILLLF